MSKGTSTFVIQRGSGALLVPLTVWFLWSFVRLAANGADYETVRAWASSPVNAVIFGIFILANVIHMRIGVMEVTEDYIHNAGIKGLLLTLNWLVALGVAAATIYSVYVLAFAG